MERCGLESDCGEQKRIGGEGSGGLHKLATKVKKDREGSQWEHMAQVRFLADGGCEHVCREAPRKQEEISD